MGAFTSAVLIAVWFVVTLGSGMGFLLADFAPARVRAMYGAVFGICMVSGLAFVIKSFS